MLHRVAEQVLDDPLHHRGVRHNGDRRDVDRETTLRDQVGVRDDLADQRTDVDRFEVRLREPSVQTLQIQEVRDDPIELPRVRRDATRHVAGLVFGDLDVVALHRDRETEDRGERRAEVVRDGLQERRLHLVLDAQALRLRSLAFQITLQVLGPPLFGDVDQHALPVDRAAFVVEHEPRLVLDPDLMPVARDQPIRGCVRLTTRGARLHQRSVVRMDEFRPQTLVGVPRLGLVPEDRPGLRADVDGRTIIHRVDVGDRGDLLDQRSVARLGLGELAGRLLERRDVDHDALPVRGLPIGPAHHHGLVAEPHDATVARTHPVLAEERLAGQLGTAVLLDHIRPVVLVDRLEPDARITHPFVRGDPDELLDPRVDVDQLEAVARDLLAVDDRGDLLHERAVPILGLARPLFGLALQRDVVHDPLPVERAPGLVPDQRRLVAEPADVAVAREHPVVGLEGAARALDALVFPADPHPVVRVELAGPRRRIFDPLLRREPQDLLHLRAHVQHLADAVVLAGDGFEVDDRR